MSPRTGVPRSPSSGQVVLIGCAALFLCAGCRRARETVPARNPDNAGAVWRLSPSEARLGHPVLIRGAVTYFDSRLGLLTVQDSTAGIALDTAGVLPPLSPGQTVEVQGFTGYEANAPIIVKPTIRTVGDTRQEPHARRVDPQSLWDGRADYQWVEVAAKLVERMALDSEHARYKVSFTGREAECTVATSEVPALTSLVGADVLIRAVPIASRSASGSVLGVQLYVPLRDNIVAANPRRAGRGQVSNIQRQTPPGSGLPLLTSAFQIKSLSQEEADRHYPVHLRAVVTLLNPEWSGPVLQDRSAGIYAWIDPRDREGWQVGDLVEVEGVSSSGGFSPTIWARSARRLGPGALPAPRAFQGEQVFGRDENAWVRLSGVVRSIGKWQKTGLTVNVASDWGLIPVRIVEASSVPHPERLIDAEVTVDAVGGPLFDAQRHLYAFQLVAQSAAQMKVTHSPAPNLETLPLMPLTSLLRFNASSPLNHRIRVIGTVVLRQHKGDVYLAGDDGGMLVRSGGMPNVRVGDQVEAAGFLPARTMSLALEDAVFLRSSQPGRLPGPKDITVDEAANGSHDARFVRLTAFLVSHNVVRGDHLLTLSAGRKQFNAVLDHPQYSSFLESLTEGSKLQVTGICHVDFDATRFPPQPTAFEILVPSVEDIRLLERAPWWTLRKALIVAGIMAGAVLLVLAWVLILRKRVAAQAEVLRERMEHEARLRAKLEEAHKMESLGRLAGGVAHDFNNLLTVINGYSDLLLKNPTLGESFKRTIKEIANAGSRAAGMTAQLLAFSRRQVLQPRVIDLNSVIAGTESMLRRLIGERIRLEVALKSEAGMVHADPTQITQVLMNLAVNAKDAMPEGGRLLIHTADVDMDAHFQTQSSRLDAQDERPSPGPYVSLSVTDEGAGMDEETLSHIFEPFFTTKRVGQGTGLGLATVFGIVKQSRGHITVQSAPGRGSAFHIFLPRAAGTPEPQRAAPSPDLTGKETILVVEDQPEVLALVMSVLRQFGYDVLGAKDPHQSLALMRDHQGAVDLVLTDVIMPGMTGRQLAAEMERMRPGIRILFMSGYSNSELDREGLHEAGLEFIQKPFTPEVLAAKVRSVLA
jgi:signal transduction histidine kinase/CheY-like chemotaxis protein